MREFTKIGLVGRPDHQGVEETLQRLFAFLSARDLEIVLDDVTRELLQSSAGISLSRKEVISSCNLLIVVGGDGSMLRVAKHAARVQVPVIGINRGRLGFLTDILPEELEERLGQILAGNYSVEHRFLLDLYLRKNGKEEILGTALNDIVLHPGKAAQMISFELFVNDSFVNSQESDGLIVATPTGSTAYALSAGGPIMHPNLDAVVLVPMYPHSLSSRPLVVDGDSEILLRVSEKDRLEPQLSCDGEIRYSAVAGDEFIVRKQAQKLQLIHPLEHSFYQACRSKLGWGNRLVRSDD